MIADMKKGAQFRGAVAYVFAPTHRPEAIGGSVVGRDPQAVAREFGAIRRLRPDVDRPVLHVSLSFDPGGPGRCGDRRLSNDEMLTIARAWLRKMGHDPARSPWIAVRHNDQPHQHVHLIVSRIRVDGSLSREQHRDYVRNREVCRDLEREFRLQTVVPSRDPDRRPPTRGEDRALRERGVISQKEVLRHLVTEAAQGGPSLPHFIERLAARGVEVQLNRAQTGHISGISFRLGHVAVRGSALDRSLSWAGLQRVHGLQPGPVLTRAHDRQRLPGRDSAPRPRVNGAEPLRRLLGRRVERVVAVTAPPVGTVLAAFRAARSVGLAVQQPGTALVRHLVGPGLRPVLETLRQVATIARPATPIDMPREIASRGHRGNGDE